MAGETTAFVHARRRALAMGLGGLAVAIGTRTIAAPGDPVVSGDPASFIMRPPAAADAYQAPSSLSTLRDLYSRMTVPVSLEGAPPLPFVVDTGANQSVVAAEAVQALGLPLGPSQVLNGVVGDTLAPTLRIAKLKVGETPACEAGLSVLSQAAIGGAGVLGMDRLAGQRLELDFADARIRIGPHRSFRSDPTEQVLRTRSTAGRLGLLEAQAGRLRVQAFLDSGAQTTVGNLALRRAQAQRAPTTLWFPASITSVTGQSQAAEAAVLPELLLGDYRFKDIPVVFADLHPFRMWGLIDTPAVLVGVDVLSRFSRVSLDYSRGEVRLRAPGFA